MRNDVTDASWWSDAVGYEVYLRSFADSDGDGIGDLTGLTARLDHLADLGVDLVWVTPFYPSPMADFGYDVADHTDVDPRFGTLDDFDRLVAGVHDHGMRLLIDLVPNHTSDQHAWFRSARSGRHSPHRDHYLWRDPGPDGGPPNNWRSHFGGPAWSYDEASGQWWCHLFLPEQPDLNWANPAVREKFRAILRHWLERGVDGFRIDVAHALVKHPSLADDPVLVEVGPDATPGEAFHALRHDHDLGQPGTLDIYRDWHEMARDHGAVLLGEVYLEEPEAVAAYVAEDVLDLSFYFPVLHTTWDAAVLREVVTATLAHGRGRFAWVHSSHDDPRAATRFGGGERGRHRALSFLAFTAFLPGPLFLYQGDELGLVDGEVPADAVADPVAVRNEHGAGEGRDPVRTPMPWTPDQPNLGFTTGTPWLPVASNHTAADTVAAQRADPASTLHAVRRLLQARRARVPNHSEVELRTDVPEGVLAYRRGAQLVVLNTGPESVPVSWSGSGALVFGNGDVQVDPERLGVGPDAVAVVDEGR